jgi:ribose transport system substrate-binding protein
MASRWLIGSTALLVSIIVAASGGALAHSASNLPAATANADNYDAAPAFDAPGPAFDATKARGKSIFIIPATPEALMLPSVGQMIGGIRQAAAVVGVKTFACANNGSDASWTACFKQATAKKVTAIVLAGGTEPAADSSLVTTATQSGIKVIAGHVPNPGDFTGDIAAAYTKSEAGLTAIVPAPYAEIGKLLADEVTVDRPTPTGRFLIIGSSDIPANAGLLTSVQAELAAVCGSVCPVSTIDIPYSTWPTAAVSMGASSTLAANTTTFIPLFDKISGYLAEGVHDARLAAAAAVQPRIHSYGGTPFVIQMGQDNNRVEGDVAENMNWLGWATMDQTLRVLTGTKTVADENTGLRFVDDDAWGAEGVGPEGWSFPPLLDQGWGDPRGDDGWITGYTKLWGVPIKSDGYQLSGGAGGGDDD